MAEPVHGGLAEEAREALSASGRAAREDFPARVRELFARIATDENELVALLAPDGTLLEVNPPALAAGGLEREAVVGRPFWRTPWWSASPKVATRLAAAVRRAAGGRLVRFEAAVLAAAGTATVTLDLTLRPVKDPAGRVAFLLAEGRDVTPLRREREALRSALADQVEEVQRLEEALSRRRRELETAIEAMRFAREQADRVSAQKASLLRVVSHELRTPLAALLLQVDRLRRDAAELSPRHREVVARTRSATNRLTTLVDSLLEYSRLDGERVTVAPARLDPSTLAAGVLEELRPLAEGKHLALSCPEAGPVPPIETDGRLLRLVLLNLVQNAVKFTETGSVSVSIAAEGGEHRLSVRDTGRGIAPEDQARIFEPFEQLEAVSRKHTPGIGLGLALVREMVGALGGRIALESRPGVGSTFTVWLPSRSRPSGREEAAAPTPH